VIGVVPTDKLTLTESARWPSVPISSVFTSIEQGWSPQCEQKGIASESSWAVIKTTAIQPLRFVADENKKLPKMLDPRPHLCLLAGDILITRAGPRNRVGISCLVTGNHPCLMLCDKAYRLRCNSAVITPEFLVLALNAPQFIDALEQLKTGISDSGVNLTQQRFGDLPLSVPSLEEQRRIVSALDERLSELDAAVTSLDRAERKIVRYRAAVLAAACSGNLITSGTPSGSWENTSLAVMKSFSLYGPRFPSEKYAESGPYVVRTTDVNSSGRINVASAPRLALSASEIQKYRLERKDLLFTRTGSIGTLAVFDDDADAIPGAYMIQYRLKEPSCAKFIELVFRAPIGQRRLLDGSAGIGRLNLNAPTIESVAFKLPPAKDRQLILAEVDRHFSRADALEDSIAQAKRRAQRLRNAILTAAFQGRLVPQDPKDEPASVLLDRIRAQAAAAEAATPMRRRGRPPGSSKATSHTAVSETVSGPKRRGRPPGRAMAATSRSADEGNQAPKRRGRPPGSKNRPKS